MAKRRSKISKTLSRAEVKERHLPWFELSKYERCKHFGAIDWFQQVACRIDLHRMNSLWGTPSSEHSLAELAKAVSYAELLSRTQSYGLIPRALISDLQAGSRDLSPERFATLALLDIQGCAVRSMTVSDLLRVARACDRDMLYEADQQLQDDRWALYPERAAGTLLSRTLKSSLPSSTSASNLAYLVVDWNQPASLIATQLKELIARQHAECFYAPAAPKEASNPSFEVWRRAQVLAYIDLVFWRKCLSDKSLRKQITDELIAEYIELSPDSVRHTTQTNAHDLMDPLGTTFSALREQAISEARQLQDHAS